MLVQKESPSYRSAQVVRQNLWERVSAWPVLLDGSCRGVNTVKQCGPLIDVFVSLGLSILGYLVFFSSWGLLIYCTSELWSHCNFSSFLQLILFELCNGTSRLPSIIPWCKIYVGLVYILYFFLCGGIVIYFIEQHFCSILWGNNSVVPRLRGQ